jgi:hypothetical protein
VTVTGATVTANGAAGITSSGGTVTVTGATVTANDGGGISVTGGVFKLVNNFIYRNGKSSSAVGGVNLNGTPAGSVFEFNTVVDNDASSGITHPGGVLCDLPAFAIGNNIIAKNRSNTDPNGATSQLSGQCTTPGSRIQADFTGLNFKSPVTSPFDYHLLAGSTAIDAASAVSPVVTDADGDARPQGAGKDQGADEFKP